MNEILILILMFFFFVGKADKGRILNSVLVEDSLKFCFLIQFFRVYVNNYDSKCKIIISW